MISNKYSGRYLTKLYNLYSTKSTYGEDSSQYKKALKKFQEYHDSWFKEKDKVDYSHVTQEFINQNAANMDD